MTAAVYIVGGTNRTHEELRYSLRSLVNAPDITQVWVVGHIPEWVTGMKVLPLDAAPEKFANIRQSLTAFANTKGAPKRFYLFNEDMYVVEPVDGELPTYHLGLTRPWLTEFWRDKNTWFRAVKNTYDWLRDRTGVDDLPLYEAHTPLLLDRARTAQFLAEYPADQSVAVAGAYHLAGLGGEGVDAGNAKVGADDDFDAKRAQNMPFLSGNQNTFDGTVGRLLRAMFPEPCKYEK